MPATSLVWFQTGFVCEYSTLMVGSLGSITGQTTCHQAVIICFDEQPLLSAMTQGIPVDWRTGFVKVAQVVIRASASR